MRPTKSCQSSWRRSRPPSETKDAAPPDPNPKSQIRNPKYSHPRYTSPMTSVCFYFQVHQPHRLRRYSVFHSDPFYFEDSKTAEICRKVADKCYRPATSLILDLVRKHKGNFRVAYSITGTVLDQMEAYAPDVIGIFQE